MMLASSTNIKTGSTKRKLRRKGKGQREKKVRGGEERKTTRKFINISAVGFKALYLEVRGAQKNHFGDSTG
jgi:hypothetical protein